MFSTPLISCSSGAATVSAITLGLAPGYCAFTTIVGGTTSGYWLMGSRHMAMAPIRKMMIDSTAAKIGRSMKKRANFIKIPLETGAKRPQHHGAAPWRTGQWRSTIGFEARPHRPGGRAGWLLSHIRGGQHRALGQASIHRHLF